MPDQSSLELRLQRAEDRLDLLQLEGAYAFLYDKGDGQGWADLFTEDGVYSMRQLAGMNEMPFIQGRANLAKFCDSNQVSSVHLLNLPHHVIDGDQATGRIHLQHRGKSIDEYGRPTVTEAIGYYDVAYRRTDEGWRIHRRVTCFYDRRSLITYGYEPSVADLDVPPLPASGEYPYRVGG